MKVWQKIAVVAVIGIVCFGITLKICRHTSFSSPSSKGAAGVGVFSAPVRLDGTVMSVAEFQTWLKKRGHYKGKIDGKVSKDYINSLTQTAWDAAYNDQCGTEDVRLALGGE